MNLFMHSFKKKSIGMFWCKVGIMSFIIVLLAAVLNQITDPYYSWKHYGAYRDKLTTLKNIDTPKTIFVGGSSVLFGVNAAYYEKLSGEKAINMGLHAMRSPHIYLSCIEPYVHAGDTVIIAFEYGVYSSDDRWREYDNVGLDVAHLSGEYYERIPPENRMTYSYQQLLRSYERFPLYVYDQISSRYTGTEKVYLRENINTYGDLIESIDTASQTPKPSDDKLVFNEKSAEYIMNYIQLFENQGAEVYLAFAPWLNPGLSKQEKEAYFIAFRNFFGEIVLGEPEDWILEDPQMFYDTQYHLTRDAALEHTAYYYNLIRGK